MLALVPFRQCTKPLGSPYRDMFQGRFPQREACKGCCPGLSRTFLPMPHQGQFLASRVLVGSLSTLPCESSAF